MFINTKHIISDQRNSIQNTIIKLLKLEFNLGVFAEQDLYVIVGNLNEAGAIMALEAIN